jgi:hypothetical protein
MSWRSQWKRCASLASMIPPCSDVAAASALFVLPVRGDAELGHAVHVARADLHLHALAVGAEHRRVQRLVAVGLGQRDVVLEAPGDRGEHPVHHPEHRVAVGHVLDDTRNAMTS